MMSDINEPSQTVGRGTLGGHPGGVISGETFRWWKQLIDDNRGSIIITAHHYVLKDTTVASGEWEGMALGYFEQGTESAYTHCPKAFMRSKLWDASTFVDAKELPSSGEILREIQGGDFDAEDYDQKRAERYARREGFY